MEAALLMVDVIAMVLVGYWCVRNDGWQPGGRMSGLFRFPDSKEAIKARAAKLPPPPPPMIRPAKR